MNNSKRDSSMLQIACEMTTSQGGPTRSALGVSNYLPNGHQFVIVGNIDSSIEAILISGRIPYRTLRSDFNNKSGFCLRDLPELIKMIRKSDVIVCHGFYTFPTLISCILGKDKAVYLMPHGSLEEYEWARSKLKKMFFDRLMEFSSNFKQIIFTCATIEETHSIKKKYQLNRVEVVGIAVDLPEIQMLQVKATDATMNLLSISRIAPKKRIDTSIRAISLMRGTILEPNLWIYGGGDEKLTATLKKLALDLDVDKFVHFEGTIDHGDILNLFSKMDILLLPSENENFAISVAESIAHHVPVIVSRAVALSSFVEENLCGLVIESSSPNLLKDAVLKMSSNLDFYRKACIVAKHKLGHVHVQKNWNSLLGIPTKEGF